jgi:hypothetical protein
MKNLTPTFRGFRKKRNQTPLALGFDCTDVARVSENWFFQNQRLLVQISGFAHCAVVVHGVVGLQSK